MGIIEDARAAVVILDVIPRRVVHLVTEVVSAVAVGVTDVEDRAPLVVVVGEEPVIRLELRLRLCCHTNSSLGILNASLAAMTAFSRL